MMSLVLFAGILLISPCTPVFGAEIHVSPSGDDANPGSESKPLASLGAAQAVARKIRGTGPATVILHKGTYYLPEPLVLTGEDSGTEFRGTGEGAVVVSGAIPLDLKWEPWKDGILQARTKPGILIDQVFVNGRLQHMARYPNFDSAAIKPKRFGAGANFDPDAPKFNGASGSSTSPERVGRWADPAGGYLHTLQAALWGSLHYRILGKKADGTLDLEGGWQHNRPDKGAHKDFRFVENVLEELDVAGEWFHDSKAGILYLYPPKGVDMKIARVEGVRLRHLVEFSGTIEHPLKSVSMKGITFTAAGRTFMENKESLLRSDWTIYRGGALFLRGTENCSIIDCDFEQLGGNALFISGYNRNATVRGCMIRDCGANGIAIVGEAKAVRSPMFSWGPGNPWSGGKPEMAPEDIDRTPGPLTADYPANCLIEDCLITRIGRLEKQSACVEISMAQNITVRHCSLYEVPRAGINVGDGCWGGHVIEFCDVFDTVLETGDHGSFNSWGRDRYWAGAQSLMKKKNAAIPMAEFAFADAIKPIILRNNRWRCDYGFDVDLDDGSSNYEIHDNLMLGRGLKLREGFRRLVSNNIIVNNTMHPHCWFPSSKDVFTRNIVMQAYQPSHMLTDLWGEEADKNKWGREIDWNLFTTSEADRTKFAANGCDKNSLVGDPMFNDLAKGDYRVREGSPALRLGFKNFPMDQFGVISPRLKRIARTPDFPKIERYAPAAAASVKLQEWKGAKLRELEELEFSALQIPAGEKGVVVQECPAKSTAYGMGLRTGDFIRSTNDRAVQGVSDFIGAVAKTVPGKSPKLSILRSQKDIILELQEHVK